MNDFDSLYSSINLRKLIDEINYKSRFVLGESSRSFTDSIVKIAKEHFTSVIPAGSTLYRARMNNIDFGEKEHHKTPFQPKEMGCPPQHLAISGRINPEGIPYLYCAEERDTAAAELRPGKDSYLTIAEIDIHQDIRIVDLTIETEQDDLYLFHDEFSELFSTQWPPELKLNYLVTQYFSEHFKAAGLKGVKYASAFNNGGNNFALFHECDYEIAETYCIRTGEIDYSFWKHPFDISEIPYAAEIIPASILSLITDSQSKPCVDKQQDNECTNNTQILFSRTMKILRCGGIWTSRS